MSGGNEFQDKAQKLMQRLSNAQKQPRSRQDVYQPVRPMSTHELMKIGEEIEASDLQAKKKMKILQEQLRKLQTSLIEQNQNRTKLNQNFANSVVKVEKNLKTVLNSVRKTFAQKQKKLQEKIQSLLKVQRKDIELKLKQNEQMVEDIKRLESKVMAIVEQVNILKKARSQLQQKIHKQFSDQIKELKHIFQANVREREQKQNRALVSLKQIYKSMMEKIYSQQKERQGSEKMLIEVVEQLVNRILEA